MERGTREKLRAKLFGLVFQIREAMQEVVQDAETGLTVQQVAILRALVESRRMSQAALGKKIGRDKAQISRSVADLTAKGLIKKARDDQDKRSYILEAREDVAERVKVFLRGELDLVEAMTGGLSSTDIDKLYEILCVMTENLSRAP